MKAKITLLMWSRGHCLTHPFRKVMLRAYHNRKKKNKQKHAKIKFNCSFGRCFYTVMSLGYKVLTDYYIKLQSNANSGQCINCSGRAHQIVSLLSYHNTDLYIIVSGNRFGAPYNIPYTYNYSFIDLMSLFALCLHHVMKPSI